MMLKVLAKPLRQGLRAYLISLLKLVGRMGTCRMTAVLMLGLMEFHVQCGLVDCKWWMLRLVGMQ